MSGLKFRNITASVDDPVETWPFEGVLAAVERGTLPDWRRLAAAIRADPWGPVAQQVLEAIEIARPDGTSELLTAVIERARRDAAAERDEVAAKYATSSPDPACRLRHRPLVAARPPPQRERGERRCYEEAEADGAGGDRADG